jgi:hypothetical protein
MNDPTKLVLLVHGVGSPEPGETLKEFESSVASVQTGNIQSRRFWITFDESHHGARQVESRDVFAIDQMGEETLRFAEVNWTDLSRVGSSLAGLVWSFLELILYMYDARDAACTKDDVGGSLRRKMGRWIKTLLHGPVAALNIQMLIAVVFTALAKLALETTEADQRGHGCI